MLGNSCESEDNIEKFVDTFAVNTKLNYEIIQLHDHSLNVTTSVSSAVDVAYLSYEKSLLSYLYLQKNLIRTNDHLFANPPGISSIEKTFYNIGRIV